MRMLLLLLALGSLSCSGPRYQQVIGQHTERCGLTGENVTPEPACGVAILDSETGTVFVRDNAEWLEENPITGKVTIHHLN